MNPQATLFQFIGGSMENAANQFVGQSVHRLIETIYPWALTGLILYVIAWGLLVMNSMIKRPGKEGALKALTVLLVSLFALNADTYLTWVMGTLQDMQVRVTAAVTGRPGESIYAVLDGLLNQGLDMVSVAVTKALDAGWTEFGSMLSYFLIAGCIAVAFLLVCVTGGIAIITALALLKVLFAIGPFCIVALLFPVTAKLFEGWFGAVVTFVLSVAMAAGVIALTIPVMEEMVENFGLTNPAHEEQNTLLYALCILALGVVLQSLVAGTGLLASRLGGGVVMATMDAIGAARLAMAPVQAAKQIVNPTSSRLDPSTGHKVHGSRLEHIVSGRTVMNPVYRRGIQRMIANNWQSPSQSGGAIKKVTSPKPSSGGPKP